VNKLLLLLYHKDSKIFLADPVSKGKDRFKEEVRGHVQGRPGACPHAIRQGAEVSWSTLSAQSGVQEARRDDRNR
jgi:hypothetical protein